MLEFIVSSMVFVMVLLLVTGVAPVGIVAIASDSMYPTFTKGYGVLTLKVSQDKLNEGDIISFKKGDRRVIHRIATIEKVDDEVRYYTKGDANNVVDTGYLTYEDIDNKVILSIPLIGYPSIIINDLFS